jgi:hypothetical protein
MLQRGRGEPVVQNSGRHTRRESTARRLLTKLSCSKSENVTRDADTRHVLIASAKAGRRIATVHDSEPVDPRHIAVPTDNRAKTWPQTTATASKDTEMICVLKICRPSKVALMQRRAELLSGLIRDPPVRVELIAMASICDEPVERCC